MFKWDCYKDLLKKSLAFNKRIVPQGTCRKSI